MSDFYEYECECLECLHKWTTKPVENPPIECPECESNDVRILGKKRVEVEKNE